MHTSLQVLLEDNTFQDGGQRKRANVSLEWGSCLGFCFLNYSSFYYILLDLRFLANQESLKNTYSHIRAAIQPGNLLGELNIPAIIIIYNAFYIRVCVYEITYKLATHLNEWG